MEREQFFTDFNNGLHKLGRFTMVSVILILSAVPFVMGWCYGVRPDMEGFLSGYLKVAVIYLPVSLVEFLVYAPMLGVGGSYLSFITGNVTNMKIPCVMNSKDIAGTQAGTPEDEIISTISTATSAIVTMLVILVGVIMLVPLQPILQNEMLLPAFNNVVPALFGALGLKYFAKAPQVAIFPVVLMSALCIFVPSMINETSVLMIPAGVMALALGFVFFKKGKL